jgi:hypothetical protein
VLLRRQAAQDLLVDRPLADAVDERFDDAKVDVGFEQREADLAQRGIDRVLGQPGVAAEGAEDLLQARAQRVEHLTLQSP